MYGVPTSCPKEGWGRCAWCGVGQCGVCGAVCAVYSAVNRYRPGLCLISSRRHHACLGVGVNRGVRHARQAGAAFAFHSCLSRRRSPALPLAGHALLTRRQHSGARQPKAGAPALSERGRERRRNRGIEKNWCSVARAELFRHAYAQSFCRACAFMPAPQTRHFIHRKVWAK